MAHVERIAAVAHDGGAHGEHVPLVVIADREARVERVALAGDLHVDVAVELQAHRAPGLPGSERHQRGEAVALGLLAAEASPHARDLHDDLAHGQGKDVRDDRLDLGRVLARRADEDVVVVAALGPCGLGLEVEVLLSADVERPVERVGARAQGGVHVAARDDVRLVVVALGLDRGVEPEDGGERLGHDDGLRGGAAARPLRLADDGGDHLAVKRDLALREERLVVADRADVVHPGDIRRGDDVDHPRHGARGAQVDRDEPRVRMGRRDRPDLEHPGPSRGLVVDVDRAARHVTPRALVAERGGRGSVRGRLRGDEVARRVLRLALLVTPELLEQAADEGASERAPRADIVDGGERAAEDLERPLERRVGEGASDEEALGFGSADRHRGDPAVGEPRVADDVGVVEVEGEGGCHDADVELAALADLEGARAAHEAGKRPDAARRPRGRSRPGRGASSCTRRRSRRRGRCTVRAWTRARPWRRATGAPAPGRRWARRWRGCRRG